jgi:hypothetical protein
VIGFLADENFSGPVVRGLRRRHPDLDIVTVQEVGLTSADDPTVLEWAAAHDRLVITNDARTMIGFAKQSAGLPMPGLIEAGKRMSVRAAIENLHTMAVCSEPGEWEGQVIHLPL